MPDKNDVFINQSRYEELLDIETRVNVVVERLYHDSYLSEEDILWILGTDLAVTKAQKIRLDKQNSERGGK